MPETGTSISSYGVGDGWTCLGVSSHGPRTDSIERLLFFFLPQLEQG